MKNEPLILPEPPVELVTEEESSIKESETTKISLSSQEIHVVAHDEDVSPAPTLPKRKAKKKKNKVKRESSLQMKSQSTEKDISAENLSEECKKSISKKSI